VQGKYEKGEEGRKGRIVSRSRASLKKRQTRQPGIGREERAGGVGVGGESESRCFRFVPGLPSTRGGIGRGEPI
jgi:hypothetical protein